MLGMSQLEGETSVPFVDGVAEFTRLRVDREASRLSLSFTTLPERFQSETSIEFSVVPFHDSVERKQVSFLLSGVPVPDSVEWNGDSVNEEVVRGVGVALDMDPSRIKYMALQELDWVCHYLFTSVQDKREHTAHMQGIHIYTIYGSPFVNIIVPFIRA